MVDGKVMDLVTTDALDRIVALAVDAVPSPRTKQAYRDTLSRFLLWYRSQSGEPLSRALVMRWRSEMMASGAGPATVNLRLSAVRKLAREASANGLIPEAVSMGICGIPGVPQAGMRQGNWLTPQQLAMLLARPDASTRTGRRDRAIFALLVGAWLRREESTTVRFDQIQSRDGRPCIADLVRKRGRIETVPLPSWAAEWIESWRHDANHELVLAGISATMVYARVRHYAEACGYTLSPHDLRRTCARIARDADAGIQQIQRQLGHASIATTERYMGQLRSLTVSACDFIDPTAV